MAATQPHSLDDYARDVSSLIDPAKLATLRGSAINRRVPKYVALLAEAEEHGIAPKKVVGRAVAKVGMKSEAAKLTAKKMVQNLEIARRYGCLDAEGLSAMRKGQAPTVRKGSSRGQELSVDHVIPQKVVPELANVIANLQLMPLKANESKNSKVGEKQLKLGRKLHNAELLSAQGLRALEEAVRRPGAQPP